MTDKERKKMLDEVDQEVGQILADAIAKLGGCSTAELKAIAADALDRERLEQLMAIVRDVTR